MKTFSTPSCSFTETFTFNSPDSGVALMNLEGIKRGWDDGVDVIISTSE